MLRGAKDFFWRNTKSRSKKTKVWSKTFLQGICSGDTIGSFKSRCFEMSQSRLATKGILHSVYFGLCGILETLMLRHVLPSLNDSFDGNVDFNIGIKIGTISKNC